MTLIKNEMRKKSTLILLGCILVVFAVAGMAMVGTAYDSGFTDSNNDIKILNTEKELKVTVM